MRASPPKLLLSLLTAALLSGCAVHHHADTRYRGEVARVAQVQEGTVISVRAVRLQAQPSGAGTMTGAIVGGVAGSSVGGHRESLAFGALGALLGGVIGSAIERDAGQHQGIELIIQLRNGERIAIVQSTGEERFAPGDAVMLIHQGRSARVTRALAPVAPEATRPAPETPR